MNDLQNRNRKTAIAAAGIVVGMIGLSYASVPLYDWFCRVTGFGGTTQVAEAAPAEIGERRIKVRFNADTAKGMPWRFQPVQREIEVRVGESALGFYIAQNPTDESVKGTATFNVTPLKAGIYFNKIECFCFTEQTLTAGQSIDMPVSFFVDPAISEDPNLDDVKTITLSYTFFPMKDEDGDDKPVKVTERAADAAETVSLN